MSSKPLSSTKNELIDLLKTLKGSFYFAAFISLFINILMLVPTLYMLQLYDRVLASRSMETLIMLTIIVVFLFFVLGMLEFIRSRILIRVGNAIDAKMSNRLFDAMFALANRHPGKATAQPLGDLTQIRQFLTGTPLFAFFDAPWIPIYIGIMFLFHPLFGYFAIFAAIVAVSLTLINEKRTKAGLEASNKHYQSSQSFISSSLRNSEIIEAMGMHGNIRRRWYGRYISFLNEQSNASDEAGVWSNTSKIVRMLMQSLVLGLGGYLAIIGEVTPGMMIAGSIIMGRALAPIDLMTGTWKQFSGARTSYGRLGGLLAEFTVPVKPTPLPAPQGFIDLEQIVVLPPDSKVPSIRGVTLSIKAGETVAVIGPSAAGKSSLARAMLGVWPCVNGKVRIDGAEIGHYDREVLGQYIGYLPQDIELFDGTISENIARYEDPKPEMVVEAAQVAGVHEMILQLPQGYDTPIGPGGIALSGGQRQRVGLARAIYCYPKIIVLDEPNSNLDDVGERALTQAILELKKRGSTVILITHRPAILGIVDRIAFMRDGLLQLFGTRDEVLAALQPKPQAPIQNDQGTQS
ncbi:MAG TPA: type I secretion system permease/ATPase [Sulfuricurvum sp.]|nr:MAG: type I secretion system permease/ATPase [Campylobacterales bacterium 16-40-21]OZA02651.1 MAG: type I secretion system permease/ATPase [Sulfuricurvum sp. 17-40-25]HQS67427.1 type I secretion system permease/ATPase [Sulfuricurvum sp.]HQT36467.1 type I secretion system permease/ATPase [Sulfuricurvum sp.]